MLVGAPSYISPERARGKPPGPAGRPVVAGRAAVRRRRGPPALRQGLGDLDPDGRHDRAGARPRNAGELSEVIAGLLVKDPEKRLDVDGARVLLEPVAFGMTSGSKSPGPDGGSANTRTSVLPTVPAPPPPRAPAVGRPGRRFRARPP